MIHRKLCNCQVHLRLQIYAVFNICSWIVIFGCMCVCATTDLHFLRDSVTFRAS